MVELERMLSARSRRSRCDLIFLPGGFRASGAFPRASLHHQSRYIQSCTRCSVNVGGGVRIKNRLDEFQRRRKRCDECLPIQLRRRNRRTRLRWWCSVLVRCEVVAETAEPSLCGAAVAIGACGGSGGCERRCSSSAIKRPMS